MAMRPSVSRSQGSGAFAFQRRSSCISRPSPGVNSPEPPIEGMYEEGRSGWLAAWEDRLKLREAEGRVAKPSRATPVMQICCRSCTHLLSDEGMEVFYKCTPEVAAYCSNQEPYGITEEVRDMNHGLCGCQLRQFSCRCGVIVGYRMYQRCPDCSQDNDEGQEWFFEAERVGARPRRNESGDLIVWRGAFSPQDSSLTDSQGVEEYYDENRAARMDVDPNRGWGVSPLADRNGRSQVTGAKINSDYTKIQAELTQKERALTAQEERLASLEAERYQAELEQRSREKYLQDASAQQDQLERDLASRERAIQQRKLVLDAREMEMQEQVSHVQYGAEEATKQALRRSEQNVAIVEAEAESLRTQLAEQTTLARSNEEKLAIKNQEIQQLQTSLAEVRREARQSGVHASNSITGRGRLPPMDEVNATPQQLIKRVRDLENELSAERVELASLKRELSQAKQALEHKDEELERLLPEIVTSRKQGALRMQTRDAEVDRLRRELDSTRMELIQLRSEPARSAPSTNEPDQFAKARIEVAAQLSQRRRELDRREQAIAAQEAENAAAAQFYGPMGAAPVIGVEQRPMPQLSSHTSSGVPNSGRGTFDRLSCPRRQ